MLLLLFSLLSLRADAFVCYGKKAFDDFSCMMSGAEPNCKANAKCLFGIHEPKAIMRSKQSECMINKSKSVGMACSVHADCARECGVICHEDKCKGCTGVGGKNDCMLMVSEGLKCRWSGGTEMGVCRDDAGCYGKKAEHHHGCSIRGYDAKLCLENNDICDFGIDPWKEKARAYETCVDDGGFFGKPCDTSDECSKDCSTGQMCMKFGGMGSCVGCYDLGTEEECNTGKDNGLKCVWTGMMGTGMCLADESAPKTMDPTAKPTPMPVVETTLSPTAPVTVDPTAKPTPLPVVETSLSPTAPVTVDPTAKPTPLPVVETTQSPTAHVTVDPTAKPTPMPVDPETLSPTVAAPMDKCAGKGRGECKKEADCDYADNMCKLNYTPECAGKKVDIHFRCAPMENEADCLAVVPRPFGGEPLCTWGRNEMDKDVEVLKCMRENNMPVGMRCTDDNDCKCGLTCFDMGFMKACSTCRDMGDRADCESLKGGACKWAGIGEDAICFQPYPKDACSEYTDSASCKAESMCEFKSGDCITLVATKKVCKKRGKNKSDSIELREQHCQAVAGCKFSVKTKKGKTKAKCKFSKKKN